MCICMYIYAEMSLVWNLVQRHNMAALKITWLTFLSCLNTSISIVKVDEFETDKLPWIKIVFLFNAGGTDLVKCLLAM